MHIQTPARSGAEIAATARSLSAGPVRANCWLDLTGVLVHAEVAMKELGDGTFVPAVVMELDDVGAGHHHVVAHVLYPRGGRDQAEAKAKSLKRGQQITVSTQLADIRMLLPAASIFNDATQ